MIPKYRNQSIILILSGAGLIILAFATYGVCSMNDLRRLGGCLGVILGLFGVLLYQWGGFTLAKAKGYSSDVPAGVLTIGLLCCGMVFFITPFIVLCLKDKTRHKGTRHSRSRSEQKPTGLAICSISLSTVAWILAISVMVIPALSLPSREPVVQLAKWVVTFLLLCAPLASLVFSIIVLKKGSPGRTLAILSICLTGLLLLLVLMGALMAASKHSSAAGHRAHSRNQSTRNTNYGR